MSLKARWLGFVRPVSHMEQSVSVASCVTSCAGERSRSRTCLPIMPQPSTSSFRPWSGWRRRVGGRMASTMSSSCQSTKPLRG
jgi:hypothetical protein